MTDQEWLEYIESDKQYLMFIFKDSMSNLLKAIAIYTGAISLYWVLV